MVKNFKEQIINYIKETMVEMRKVVWPDRRYVLTATLIVLVLVFLTGAYIMVVDIVLARIFGVLLK